MTMEPKLIFAIVMVGVVLLGEFFSPLLVKTRLVKLPLELSAYKLFFKKAHQFSMRLFVGALALGIVLVRPQVLELIPIQSRFSALLVIMAIVIIPIGILKAVPTLGKVCPQCGKKLKKDDDGPTIDSILVKKPCPQCKFQFAKPTRLTEPEQEEKSFFDYLTVIPPQIEILFHLILFWAFVYLYWETKPVRFDLNNPIFWLPAGFAALLGARILSRSDEKSKCSICGQAGRDNFEDGRGKTRRLCRDHMISGLEKEFLSFDKKMVVVYPGLEDRKKVSHVYQYYTTAEIKKFNMTDYVGDLTRNGLAAIAGECKKCSGSANVAYFGKGTFRWEDDYPKLEEIDQAPEILCRKCTFKQIRESLRGFQGHFNEPVTSPHKDEGIQLPWTL